MILSRELMAAGIKVSLGDDCVMDSSYSIASGDLRKIGHVAIHVAQMEGIDEQTAILDARTTNSARTKGLTGYRLAKSNSADMVLLQAQTMADALRLKPARLTVIKAGRIIAQTPARISLLSLPDQPKSVKPAPYAPKR